AYLGLLMDVITGQPQDEAAAYFLSDRDAIIVSGIPTPPSRADADGRVFPAVVGEIGLCLDLTLRLSLRRSRYGGWR
ncbi:MAG TPA: hypothetical protein VIW02_06415, partial [Gammaproteobacteria bacterium]